MVLTNILLMNLTAAACLEGTGVCPEHLADVNECSTVQCWIADVIRICHGFKILHDAAHIHAQDCAKDPC